MRRLPDGLVVVFDLDGTLVDTAGDLAAAMNEALRADGLAPLPVASVRHMIGAGARAMLVEGYSRHGVAADAGRLNTAFARFIEHYEAHIDDQSRPFPNAIAALDQLRRAGAALAVCTNKREAPARLLLDRLGLEDRFATIVGGDTALRPKPDRAPVDLAVRRAGGRACVFVGDSDTDIAAAAAAGAPCLAADFGYGPLTMIEQAFAAFSNYRDLAELVVRAAAWEPNVTAS